MAQSDKKTGSVPRQRRSACGVACSLDLLGDKWTLLVVRDLLMGKQTYSELQASEEGIPTNILADRLQRLHREGVVYKKLYQEKPKRYSYHLSEKGTDLGPVLLSMLRWANKYVPGTMSVAEVKALMKKNRR